MNTQPGTVWHNAGSVTRYSGPHADPTTVIDTINHDQSVTVLCYSLGDNMTWTTPPLPNYPNGVTNTSDAWDFVVTSDQDPGGFVADVFLDTDNKDIRVLLTVTCTILYQRLQRMSSV